MVRLYRTGCLDGNTKNIIPSTCNGKERKRPTSREANETTGEETKADSDEKARETSLAAVTLGRLGGKRGGRARAVTLEPRQRKAIATKAARMRWERYRKTQSEESTPGNSDDQ